MLKLPYESTDVLDRPLRILEIAGLCGPKIGYVFIFLFGHSRVKHKVRYIRSSHINKANTSHV